MCAARPPSPVSDQGVCAVQRMPQLDVVPSGTHQPGELQARSAGAEECAVAVPFPFRAPPTRSWIVREGRVLILVGTVGPGVGDAQVPAPAHGVLVGDGGCPLTLPGFRCGPGSLRGAAPPGPRSGRQRWRCSCPSMWAARGRLTVADVRSRRRGGRVHRRTCRPRRRCFPGRTPGW